MLDSVEYNLQQSFTQTEHAVHELKKVCIQSRMIEVCDDVVRRMILHPAEDVDGVLYC